MAADKILMGDLSSLGPIDAQIVSGGKGFSAMDGTILFPNNNKFKCSSCEAESDVLGLRQ